MYWKTKEHIIILHPHHGDGPQFKLLGCLIDPDLRMRGAIRQIAAKARPKIKAILRLRPHYSFEDMLLQYKTHIWGFHGISKWNDMSRSPIHIRCIESATAMVFARTWHLRGGSIHPVQLCSTDPSPGHWPSWLDS